MSRATTFLILLLNASCGTPLLAAEAPWGSATVLEPEYAKQKVVYDVSLRSPEALENILDRASLLSILNDADPFDHHIVLVLHGREMRYFAKANFAQYEALMRRAQSLSVGGVVEYRMCAAAARMAGMEADDIHGFITMVPMADAEIIRLQDEGYAYMR